MTRRNESLDRLIRVREVRARLAMAALGRARARQAAEAALHARVEHLLAQGGAAHGPVAANAAAARASADAMLGRLASDVGSRLAASTSETVRLGAALGRARAAVDAAIARRADREILP
jgi:3-polyprenyl-4-hydroxybenzoate decarboxylase